jgi:hypothetical protein
MNAVLRDGKSYIANKYVNHTNLDGSVMSYIQGFEYNLLKVDLYQRNMTFVHAPTPEGIQLKNGTAINLFKAMLAKNVYIALGDVGMRIWWKSILDYTSYCYFRRISCYVPCPVKYPRRSSIFRIFSVEMRLFLIISIVTAPISTTLVGRYSCTSEWQGYKTLTSSLTNVWAVIQGKSMSRTPRAPSLRSLSLS